MSVAQEEIVHVPRVVYQHRHHHAEVEQVVDLHVPHHIEETISVPKVIQPLSLTQLDSACAMSVKTTELNSPKNRTLESW